MGRPRKNETEVTRSVEVILSRYDIKKSQYLKEDREIDDLMDKVWEHAQRVKGKVSRASKAKLAEELSKVECSYAFYWKVDLGDTDFLRKFDEAKKIMQEMKIQSPCWPYYGQQIEIT